MKVSNVNFLLLQYKEIEKKLFQFLWEEADFISGIYERYSRQRIIYTSSLSCILEDEEDETIEKMLNNIISIEDMKRNNIEFIILVMGYQ